MNKIAVFKGIGLHSGRLCICRVIQNNTPAPHPGIFFKLQDHPNAPLVPALHTSVTSTNYSTTLHCLKNPNASVSTVEHLLSAMYMCNIYDAIVEVEGPEIPILDGSSLEFIESFRNVGMIRPSNVSSASNVSSVSNVSNVSNAAASNFPFLKVCQPINVRLENETTGWFLPHVNIATNTTNQTPRLTLSIDVDFTHRKLPRRIISASSTDFDFIDQVASARTFTFKEDYDALVKAGLVGGGSMDNAVLYENGAPLNTNGLRIEHEHAWHKMLDCVGDLMLAGYPIDGHYHAVKPGHTLNVAMVKELMSNETNYEICY